MSILSHEKNPSNPDWAYLAGFPSDSAVLQDDHKAWLTARVLEPAPAGRTVWVHLRGLASHRDTAEHNLRLSQDRAEAVVAFLLEDPAAAVDPDHITGLKWVGEERARGGPRDDSPQYRAVEVIVSFSPDAVMSAPAPPRRPRMIRRRVRCTLLKEPRLPAGASERGDRAAEVGRQIWESQSVRARLFWETRNVPDNQRVAAIEVGKTTQRTTIGESATHWVAFTWGRSGGDPVRLTERGRTQFVSRADARRIYNHPEGILGALDGNLPGDVVTWLRRGL